MKWVRLILCVAFFMPVCAVLGSIPSIENRGEPWLGFVVGGLVGLVAGLHFGGARGGLFGIVFPPGDEPSQEKRYD
jgi:hypothetical protein